MLGEDHSLLNENPELKELITKLTKSDRKFSEKNQKYNKIDKEIRQLELNNSPINDEAMQKLKHNRRILKDSLYEDLLLEKNKASLGS